MSGMCKLAEFLEACAAKFESDYPVQAIPTISDYLRNSAAQVREMEAENAELRRDKERLDWLVLNTVDDLPANCPESYLSLDYWKDKWRITDCRGQSWEHKEISAADTFREAIDAAMAEGGE